MSIGAGFCEVDELKGAGHWGDGVSDVILETKGLFAQGGGGCDCCGFVWFGWVVGFCDPNKYFLSSIICLQCQSTLIAASYHDCRLLDVWCLQTS
jgi:hypothetical protein